MKPYALHWFRRDLRLEGNELLSSLASEFEGRVLGIFFFDPIFLARPDFSSDRFEFFLQTLVQLRQDLRERGGDLLFLDRGPDQGFSSLFEKSPSLPQKIGFNRDYEPFARARDVRMEALFKERGIASETHRDHCLLEPLEISKPGSKDGYQVFSPFQKRWFELVHSSAFSLRLKKVKHRLPQFSLTWKEWKFSEDVLARYQKENRARVSVPIPPAGRAAALKRLKMFQENVGEYHKTRDIPALDGTSRLSIYFKNGTLTLADAVAQLELTNVDPRGKSGSAKFLSELVWREFYYSILYRFPNVEHESFLPKFRELRWENRDGYFKAWCEGRTGVPIVDAGMRQLNTTGWMHNRVRMIVASFLTKSLLVDWRWGERYFMEKLLDGDLAANNGGWQWAASTGCDPQPYFRIFNPYLQNKRWDPEGEYVRKYVPELRDVKGRDLHREPEARIAPGYPLPIVRHAESREKALEMYRMGS